MENELVKIYEYELDRNIIEKCQQENRKIGNEDVKSTIQINLEKSGIEYKNKIIEELKGFRMPKYILKVEVYVNAKDKERAEQLLAD